VPDLSHLWQRFVLATALLFGLAVGVAATIFSYSNTAPVNVGFAVFHLNSIPLWTVAIVPVVIVLVAGTLYHWWNSLHHFTEHMRHRHRVRELEAELKTLRTHLDQLLEMPGGERAKPMAKPALDEALPVEAAVEAPAPAAKNGEEPAAAKKEPVPVNGEEVTSKDT
jgi:lipopolysaccharide assembly LapA-like protein